MLNNFRNGLLAQLVLLAFVGCSMTLHADTCTNTIMLPVGGFVLDSAIASGTCIQAGDKLFDDFRLGNLPKSGGLLFGVVNSLNNVSVTFTDTFLPGHTYNFGYEVAVSGSSNFISGVSADFTQTEGTSSESATVTPTGTGAINFTKTGAIFSGTNLVTESLGVRDLTVNDSFAVGAGSDANGLLNTIHQLPRTPVPEPSPLEGLLLGTGVLGLGEMARRKLQLGT
jgi:hypothetical protein